MKHIFVFDPKAFSNRQWEMDGILDHIGQFFRTQEKSDFSIQISRYRRNAIILIQEELDKTPPGKLIRIYAVGGEEILYDCLNAIAHFPNMELAFVPHSGTNDFLCIFGENVKDVFKEIQNLVKAPSLPTDIIRWGVNYALNSCYIGLNSAAAAGLKTLRSKLGGRGVFVFSRISAFLSYIAAAFNRKITTRKYKIIIDGNDYSGSYVLIHIINGPYYSGKKTSAADAAPDDGFLDVVLIKASGPLRNIAHMNSHLRGKTARNSVMLRAKKISIQSENQMWIQLDNEYFQDTSIELTVVHHAISMVAPEGLSYPVPVITAE